MLTMDFVCQRYGVLPSHLLEKGSSIDILIADVAQTYQNRKQEEQAEMAKTGHKPPPKLSQEQMIDMINRVKKQKQKK